MPLFCQVIKIDTLSCGLFLSICFAVDNLVVLLIYSGLHALKNIQVTEGIIFQGVKVQVLLNPIMATCSSFPLTASI